VKDESGHFGWGNSKAFELLGIDENTPDTPEGFFSRTEDGKPAGQIFEDALTPFEGAILRQTVSAALRARGFGMPQRIVSTSSILFTLVTIQQTNAIAPLATAVGRAFTDRNGSGGGHDLAVLPSDLEIEVEPYALLTRTGQKLTPAAETLHDMTWMSCAGPDRSA
ncbi:hypothetical protein LCGC14_2099300, partial [marine sediment metagenome]